MLHDESPVTLEESILVSTRGIELMGGFSSSSLSYYGISYM